MTQPSLLVAVICGVVTKIRGKLPPANCQPVQIVPTHVQLPV